MLRKKLVEFFILQNESIQFCNIYLYYIYIIDIISNKRGNSIWKNTNLNNNQREVVFGKTLGLILRKCKAM